MNPRRLAVLFAACLILIGLAAVPAQSAAAPPDPLLPRCHLDAHHGARGGWEGVIVNGHCVSIAEAGGEGPPVLVTRTVACDLNGRSADKEIKTFCGPNVPRCKLLTDGGSGTAAVSYATQVQDPKTKQWITVSFWCPHAQVPVDAGPSAASIRDQAIKLLPRVAIGTTGHLHTTLVNIQTLLWADTPASRSLGTVTILGHRVALKISFGHGDWDFGDHSTDRTDSPGAAYDDKTNPCDTPQCPGYYGHTYLDTGQLTITLAVSWQASYSLDGAAWQPVGAAPLTGPSASRAITVRQARGVLVPDPGD